MIAFGLIIIPLMMIDMGLTLYSIKLLKILKPKIKNWTDAEINGMVVFFWKKYGLVKGSMLALSIQIMSFIVIFILFLNRDMIMFALGMYSLLLYFHISNIFYYKKKIKRRQYD